MQIDYNPFRLQKATVSSLLSSLTKSRKLQHNRETSIEESIFSLSQKIKKNTKSSPYAAADKSSIFQPPKYDLEKVFSFHDLEGELEDILQPKRSVSSGMYRRKSKVLERTSHSKKFIPKLKSFNFEASIRQITPSRRRKCKGNKEIPAMTGIKIKNFKPFLITRVPTIRMDTE